MVLAAAPETSSDDIIFARRGALAIVSFNRPRALNSLTTAMRSRMAETFPRLARDPGVYAAVIRSANPKAFSAGGDVREITQWGRSQPQLARLAFREEYALNWLLECFSKPTISLINGVVMGSGVGVSIYGTHRVAGENYRFAMPETAIGLFPDVGVAHVFARLPGAMGQYLGLTGRTIGRADAFRLGLATHCINSGQYDEICSGLEDAQPVDPLLDGRHLDPDDGDLAPFSALIEDCFSADTVSGIIACLSAVTSAAEPFAKSVLADLAKRSPLSLALTHRHIRDAAARDLRQTLQIDYRLACRFLDDHDFYEGVRAALIDKDHAPVWRPARIEDVTDDIVNSYFAHMGGSELTLATRQEMQAARV